MNWKLLIVYQKKICIIHSSIEIPGCVCYYVKVGRTNADKQRRKGRDRGSAVLVRRQIAK